MIDLEPVLLQLPLPAPLPGVAGGTASSLPLYLVRVSCGDGSGGAAHTAYGEALVTSAADFAEAVDFFADTVANGNPLDYGLLWQRMTALLAEYRPEPARDYASVLSAIDMALWDLAGRQLGVACRHLAGGSRARQVDCYAGGLQADDPALAEHARDLRRHYGALELSLCGAVEADGAAVKALRRAAGETTPLFVEANGKYQAYEQALAVGQALEQAEVFWFEGPLPTDDWLAYRRLREAVAPALAAERSLGDLREYVAAFSAEALDVAVADLRLCGGLSGGQRLAQLAALYGVRVSFCCGCSPLCQLAAAQLVAAHWHAGPLQVRPPAGGALKELRLALQELLQPAPVFADGFLRLPDEPGLGARFVEAALQRHRVELPSDE